MQLRLFLIVAVSLLIAARLPQDGPVKKEENKPEGAWKGVLFKYLIPPASRVGPPGFRKAQLEAVSQARWLFAADKVTIQYRQVLANEMGVEIDGKEAERQMKWKIDLKSKPKTIDLTPCAFPYTEVQEGTSKGIFELDGDTLKICYGVPGMVRPKGFFAEGDSIYMMFLLKREPTAKKVAKPKP